MRFGVVADIHGNAVALDAVLADAADAGVDRWWALGDLVLFGPRPVEVLETLAGLPGIQYVSGNTDRYVLTGDQPEPHPTNPQTAGDVALVARYAAMAGAIGWTRGALAQADALDFLAGLPATVAAELPDGKHLLGVHASPTRDDGPGIDNSCSDQDLAALFADCGAPVVIGGHTHDPTDRTAGTLRALNPGSVGLPRRAGRAHWLLIDADRRGVTADLRDVAFDVEGAVADLYRRGYPNAAFLESVLTGARTFGA